MSTFTALRDAPRRLATATRGHSRVVSAAAAAAVAAVAAGAAARRRAAETVTLPDPTALATETAVSVHNAAKSTMVAAARIEAHPDRNLIEATARAAIADGIEAGVDLVPVAIGVTSGAIDAAHLFGLSRREVAQYAVAASADAARASGATAGTRVEEAFAAISDR